MTNFENLFSQFSQMTREIAKPIGYRVADFAPDTDMPMFAQAKLGSGLVIWSGGSETSIFDCPSDNWAFRAWHDSTHLVGNAGFLCENEDFVCQLQKAAMFARFGANRMTEQFARLIDCEISGQCGYFEKTGQFVENQKAFTIDYLSKELS